MKMPILKSQNPKPYDNTEESLIIVPPSILDNKLRDFEKSHQLRNTIGGDIVLAVTFILPVLTATFKDSNYYPFGITGATISGAFIAAFIFMLVKITYSGYKIYKTNNYTRSDLIGSLLSDSKSKKNNNQKNANAKNK